MIYPIIAITYQDVHDPTRSHGLEVGALEDAVLLNPRGREDNVIIINLGDVVPRVYCSSEPHPDNAMPHQVRAWAQRLKQAFSQSQQALQKLRQLAYAGKCDRYADAWDDPDICRLAHTVAEVRELARLLTDVGCSQGLKPMPLERLVAKPISILDVNSISAATQIADAIASKA